MGAGPDHNGTRPECVDVIQASVASMASRAGEANASTPHASGSWWCSEGQSPTMDVAADGGRCIAATAPTPVDTDLAGDAAAGGGDPALHVLRRCNADASATKFACAFNHQQDCADPTVFSDYLYLLTGDRT